MIETAFTVQVIIRHSLNRWWVSDRCSDLAGKNELRLNLRAVGFNIHRSCHWKSGLCEIICVWYISFYTHTALPSSQNSCEMCHLQAVDVPANLHNARMFIWCHRQWRLCVVEIGWICRLSSGHLRRSWWDYKMVEKTIVHLHVEEIILIKCSFFWTLSLNLWYECAKALNPKPISYIQFRMGIKCCGRIKCVKPKSLAYFSPLGSGLGLEICVKYVLSIPQWTEV